MLTPRDLKIGASFVLRVGPFLRQRLDAATAEETVRQRLEHREADFLRVAREAIFAIPHSPYRRLFEIAGCQYGDLEAAVRRSGVEGALRSLYENGVYLTVDEFKGRTPVVRGGFEVAAGPDLLRNPRSAFHVAVNSGGSRGAGSAPFLIDLAFIRDCAVNCLLHLRARGGTEWVKADWEVPGGGAMFRLLKLGSFGQPPVRWFSHLDPAAPGLHARYRWSASAMWWASRVAGVPLPRAEHVPIDQPLPIARWAAAELAGGRVPYMITFASSAVRLCEAAQAAGLDLTGLQFTLGGEPTTAARLRSIRRSGAIASPRYGSIECGPVGYGCLAPEAADDVHVQRDLHALVQAREGDRSGLPARAFLVSSLRLSAPFVLLNVSMGDCGDVIERRCGCAMEQPGWTTHLSNVRSFEKLTCNGMTFMDTDVIRVLEEVLPRRFGGIPTDYQLVEGETAEGHAQLRLLVHPRLGAVDEPAVAEAFVAAIGAGETLERIMGQVWREGNVVHVVREAPQATRSGKILHFHVDR